MMVRIPVLAAAAVLTAAGCGSASSGGEHSDSTSTAATNSGSTSSPSAGATTTAPAARVPRKPKRRPPSDGLTGYGATNAAWNAHHKADTASGFIKGSAYDPDPALVRGGDPRDSDKYYGVQHDGGRVDQYQMRFPPGTTVADAMREVLASEFPSDAHGKLRTLDSCAVINVKSAKLRKATGMNAAVEFTSGAAGDTYNANDVWDAIISFGSFTEC